MTYYFDSAKAETTLKMSGQLMELIKTNNTSNTDIVILCIGSDRSTGDSLGPLTGYRLEKHHIKNVYGSLYFPVHAANLSPVISAIYNNYNNPFIIAVDASLGTPEHVGCITLGTGPLTPGLGVQKKLPKVGDIHITGIVNSSRNMDYNLLQTTHLSIVVQLADVIANVLYLALQQPDVLTNACSYMPLPPVQLYQQLLTS
ncbi:MAG: spore protease YyaC [Eubacteriales bacterium]|nr:spore protease YyaC [Eubacteriales bacterium]